ncbi:glycosyltransferase family 4 protein [Desulforhopalus singaporensis]|uniref:Glycosyltransferase involved in cell wall bisynthesis n=1 Tax=Desulforhopalus singaporensis TaxID=91360 RepID=A0A1H0UYP1_9BACT|nr:glycosyltransferase family 4 protein [Desulforhopalus singaporensis]SDP71028.1 Glycosyltransferase involved in cell wall bisynthesis [Desulforhopalus singaporensis]
MRIAFSVVKNLERGGGIEKYTYELGCRLVERGHEVTIFSMGHYGDSQPVVEGMRVVTVPCIPKASTEKLSAGASAAFAAFKSGGFDVVHCHSVAAGAFGWLPRLRGQKTVFQMHGIEWQRTRWNRIGIRVLKMLEAASLRSCHAYTAVSQTQCDFYQKHAGIEMRYIPTGADLKRKPARQEIQKLGLDADKYILFASRLVQEKGAQYLIPAFRKLDTDMKLVVAGDAQGAEAFKQQMVELAGDDSRILFPGFVGGRLLEELFSHAAVYVQPSEIEGLSIALLEAMSYGNCCLVSDIPENKEAIDGAGFTFKNKSVDDLHTQLEQLLASSDRRQSIADQARERVRCHYNWDKITDDFEVLYRGVVSAR